TMWEGGAPSRQRFSPSATRTTPWSGSWPFSPSTGSRRWRTSGASPAPESIPTSTGTASPPPCRSRASSTTGSKPSDGVGTNSGTNPPTPTVHSWPDSILPFIEFPLAQLHRVTFLQAGDILRSPSHFISFRQSPQQAEQPRINELAVLEEVPAKVALLLE